MLLLLAITQSLNPLLSSCSIEEAASQLIPSFESCLNIIDILMVSFPEDYPDNDLIPALLQIALTKLFECRAAAAAAIAVGENQRRRAVRLNNISHLWLDLLIAFLSGGKNRILMGSSPWTLWLPCRASSVVCTSCGVSWLSGQWSRLPDRW